MSRHPFTLVAIASLLASLLVFSSAPTVTNADSGNRSKLDKHGRELVATATANGNSSVTLLIAAADGTTSSVIAALRALGGTVRKSDADLGYIRVDIAADKADQASKISGVLAADVDDVIALDDPQPEAAGDVLVNPPDSTTPQQNPYMPTQDIGAPQFVAAHPTWDGRGITIGHLDTGEDLDHPALQTTSTGERKIIDWVTLTDPLTDNDPTWIVMNQTVTVVGGTFTVGSVTYTGAPDGTWKFGVFNEGDPRFGGGVGSEYSILCTPTTIGGDLNRNGVCNDKFAILWDGNTTVWVDSNADLSFADEKAMRPYKVHFDVGEFGRDNPATDVKESVPFVVQVDQTANAVNIGIVSGEHGTHVAGIMAGHGLFADATHPGFDGAAPGAKLVSIRVCLFVTGCTAHALIEGMIFAEKDAHVDTINMSIGGLPALNDGNNARAIIYNQLIDKWGAQMFISAGNSGPGVNTVGDPSVATKVMSIGAYWSQASALANYGASVNVAEALHDFSSRGPREDGGFKPEVVAPGNAVSTIPAWEGQGCLPYTCPVGYALLNGTSMAAPQATGASALLLSAAIQTGVGHKPAQLRQAMGSSSRFIANYAAHEQGFGLLRVGEAWNLLSQNVKTSDITSSVPVPNNLLSGFLATPNVGTGIYDREGVTPATAPYTRRYTFSKSNGGGGTFNLSWIGNDGTFSTNGVTSLTFSKQSTATLDVRITPGAVGAHSAILVLDDPTTAGFDYATLNTVIVAQPLNAANGYTATISGSARKFEDAAPNFFFQVPAGTTALRVNVVGLAGRTKWFRIHPYGVPIDSSSTAFTTAPYNQVRTTQVSPLAGTWEVGLAASRTTLVDPGTFTVTASAYRVDFNPTSWTVNPAAVGTPYDTTLSATNAYASGTIATTGSQFASTSTATKTIAAGGPQQLVPINVPSGSTNLTVSIGGASDPAADLDLFVFDCHTGSCILAGSSTSSTANETVSVNGPAAGQWIALIDPFAVPSGSTSYKYTDSIANPMFGSVSATTAAAPMASGDVRSVHATGTANAAAGTGRFLRASVSARLDSSTGSVIGSALVEFDTP